MLKIIITNQRLEIKASKLNLGRKCYKRKFSTLLLILLLISHANWSHMRKTMTQMMLKKCLYFDWVFAGNNLGETLPPSAMRKIELQIQTRTLPDSY